MKGFIVSICLLGYLYVVAHEEPAKTLYERNAKIAQKELYASAGVKTVSVFRLDEDLNRSKVLVMGYDKDGTYLYLESFKSDSLNLRVEYGYKKSEDMISDTDYDPSGVMIERNIFKYDREGRVISGKSFDKRRLSSTFRFVHSSDKKSIEFQKFNRDKQLEYKLIYTYLKDFDHEDYASVVKLSAEGFQQMRVVKKYNEIGKVAEKIIFGPDDSLMHSFRYTYDDRGNNTGIERLNNVGEMARIEVLIYNEKGLITEQYATDKNGEIVSRLVYEYEFFM